MNMRQIATSTPVRLAAIAAAAVAITLPTIAQTDGASANELYQQDRAACMAGQTNQSQADCLYEARSALRDRRAGNPELSPDIPNNAAPVVAQANTTSRSTTTDGGTMSSDTSTSSDGSLAPRADRN